MRYPKLRVLESSRQMVDNFKGYNHNLRIGDGEFFDMKNMTSDHYPVLSPRGNRGLYASPADPKGLISKDALCYVDGSKFVINRHEIDMGLNDYFETGLDPNEGTKHKKLISMGAYVIIMPDKKYINTQDLTDFGNIEAFYPGVEGQKITASYAMCKIDGTEYTDAYIGDTAPTSSYGIVDSVVGEYGDGTENPDSGGDSGAIEDIGGSEGTDSSESEGPAHMQLWIDTSTTPHTLKQYSATSAMWVQIATTYIKISAPNIAKNFKKYDAVKISGFPEVPRQLFEMNDITYPLWEVYHDPGAKEGDDQGEAITDIRAEGTNDYIVIVGILDEADTYTSELKIERTMPIMDFITEAGNRLYGCRYGTAANGEVVNEIYASKLGDFRNWNCMMQVSTDSWVGGVGSDGQFTGAITHMGYPLFFKENCVHKVYGQYPANFQIQTTTCRGVQKGCDRSLAIVNETLFYKARGCVCAYDGSLPTEVSYALGNEAYSEAVGGANGNKYYISMKDVSGNYNLFTYDTAKGMWHKEDDLQVDCFCSCDGEMYAISDGKIITLLGSGTPSDDPVEWMAETGEIGISSPDMKYISRLTIRMAMDIGAEFSIYAKYDFSEGWEHLTTIQGTSLRSFSLPIRPKRCDHMKLRFEGVGMTKIYSITKTIEQGSDRS